MKSFIVLIFVMASTSLFSSTWEFRTADNLEQLKHQSWKSYPNVGNPIAREYEGYIEYRSSFLSADGVPETGLYLGLIGDADKAYVNDMQVGQTGNFPPNFSYNMDTERSYYLPKDLLRNGTNQIRILVYSKFLVNKGFNPKNFKLAPVADLDRLKYLDELKTSLAKIIIPILCLVLTVVSFPLLAPKHLWNSQFMIFLIGLSSFILGICRGRSGYHFFEMLDVYKLTLVSSVVTIWLVTIFMTKSCKSWLRFVPSLISAALITSVLKSISLIEAASWGRIWFHISPVFLLVALYGNFRVSGFKSLRNFGLIILISTNLNDNLNDLRIISTTPLLQFGLGVFISFMIIDQLLGLKRSWEKYFMKEAQLEIDAEVGKQAVQIAHDLRSPLEALQKGISRIAGLPSTEQLNLSLSLSRINGICNSLLEKNDVPVMEIGFNEVVSLVREVTNEKILSNETGAQISINVSASEKAKDLYFKVNPIQFKRTLCNLVNNSIEATDSNGIVTIHVTPEECGIKLSIHDNGKGIAAHPDFLFQRGFTTKAKGNGLGLSSAKEFVESLGGKILVENLNQGTSVSLTIPALPKNLFPSVTLENHQIVLIDDDPLVRFNWKRQGRECGITVSCFESFKDFSQRMESFELETPIYIDSQLGSERGELLSEELSSFGYKNIFLTTGSPKRSLLSTKWVSDIVGKGFESAVLSRY